MKTSRELFEEYQQKYPNLFREYPRSGFDAAPGWRPLIEQLCYILESNIARLPEDVRSKFHCAQVKEKFGGLRFYMTHETEYMSGAIAVAESMSFNICEACGAPGSPRNTSWRLTLCDNHYDEHLRKKEEEKKKWAQTNHELELLEEEQEDD